MKLACEMRPSSRWQSGRLTSRLLQLGVHECHPPEHAQGGAAWLLCACYWRTAPASNPTIATIAQTSSGARHVTTLSCAKDTLKQCILQPRNAMEAAKRHRLLNRSNARMTYKITKVLGVLLACSSGQAERRHHTLSRSQIAIVPSPQAAATS